MTTPIPPPPPEKPSLQKQADPLEVELNTLLPVLLGDKSLPSPFEDAGEYLAMLDDLDLEEAVKRDLIHILQTLIETIVGIRFGVDPVTLELRDRGKKFASASRPVIKSSIIQNENLMADFASCSDGFDTETGA